ncbi:hypothetical protein BDF20DRAFT_836634 [Mycotypha africana]|uniref:uncharacterized protein n=1 Tax=Mycotypha africana TaxID=64632 RepID=UPI0023011D42|nr:uncharacterized protein BDF20DRAFT_836634 [Mycotypha africana]KAI8975211.1 hypothetical protein BDF20DRAFT_836634 [Mycotypha africana]
MQSQLIASILTVVAAFTALTSAAPTTTNNKVNGLIKRKTYHGTATWYEPESQGGPIDACTGSSISSHDRIVALNADQYGDEDSKSSWCGKHIRVCGDKGCASAKIVDLCPECGYGDLDLTPVLFKEVVGSKDQGVGEISWTLD